ncbi:SSI family serine proteinase inhibitor [Nonomuraea sp. SBT364]|uniref:SSI family serine proteinase inhibitor n=1 Tax=Nonomuraea sp. SBT364 TaxID=1580530 RepID=UPI00066A4AD5|nr:SSI family serine proteinase inhibitor [Nonomuraea sp. SBT364]
MSKAVGALALSGAFLFAAAAPAPALAERDPRSALRILVAEKGGEPKAVTLTCDRDGGTHPSPRAACRLLRKAGGDPGRLAASPGQICTRELRPHAVVVAGTWRGKPVIFGRVYSNPCLMRAAGGAVFTL